MHTDIYFCKYWKLFGGHTALSINSNKTCINKEIFVMSVCLCNGNALS